MKRAAWVLAIVFGLAFLGATLLNADLIGKSREALAHGVSLSPGAAKPERYQIIAVMPDTDDSFFRGLIDGIEAGAAEAEAAIQVFRYPGSSSSDAERYFEIALRAKVDGLIMYTPRNDRVSDRSERAARSGVVFIPVGTDAPDGGRLNFIGSGSLLQGFEGGRIICSALGPSARIGVILPATSTGDLRDELLYRGVASAVGAYSGAAIVSVVRARLGILSGEEAAARMLRTAPQVNAIFCSNAQDTEGAAQVVVDANRVDRIFIVGADETPDIDHFIDKGVIGASIVRDSRRIGQEAMIAFVHLKEGGGPRDAIELGFSVKTSKGAGN
ncbi:MAG: substrate-binding domain-containing protein [Rectinemataceae bacterium]